MLNPYIQELSQRETNDGSHLGHKIVLRHSDL
jgi:hypothetical protein